MKKSFLISELNRLAEEEQYPPYSGDFGKEMLHMKADDLLIDYINDPKIREAFEEIVKGYG